MSDAPATSTGDTTGRRPVWIVGVDGSDESRHVLRWAVAHAEPHDAIVRAVTVYSLPTPIVVGSPVVMPDLTEHRDAVIAELDEIVATTPHAPGQVIERAVELGAPAHTLLAAAKAADLLVVGSRGRGGFKRLLLGSVSHQCATHAPVPVVVIPPIGRPRRLGERATDDDRTRVVVAIDGSDDSTAALRWALRFVPRPEVVAIGVWDDVLPAELPDPDRGIDERAARKDFEHVVDEVVSASGLDVPVERHWERGDPRTRIFEAAAGADLLVTGTRGHGAIGSAILGSTSTWLVHHTDVPMALVPAVEHHLVPADDD